MPPRKRSSSMSNGIIKPKNKSRNVRGEISFEAFFVKIFVVELEAATKSERKNQSMKQL